MRDNDLIRLFRPLIENGLITAGISGVQVVQNNQPTLQGVNTLPTVFYHKVSDARYGHVYRVDEWDEDEEIMRHKEEQWYETTFQIGCLYRQSPTTPYQLTASDLINEVSAIMQSSSTVKSLGDSGVGILRVSDIRNPYFVDDRDEFEAFPSFDFILTHKQTRITTEPVVDEFEFNLYRV